MNLLAPWALGGLVLVPVIVLLQLLAPKARRVVVSWLHPWEGFARAASGGAARWRMRLKSPALWLELAILLFLVLSLARPVVMVESSRHPVVRLVVDRSATMAIRDRGAHAFGGANSAGRRMSRWEFARGMVAGLLKNIPAGAKVELVVVPAEQTGAEVLQLDAGEVAAHLNRRGPLLKFAAHQWAQEHLLPPTGSMPVIVVTDVAPGDTGEGVFVLATGAAGQSGAAIVRAGARVEDGRWFVLVALRNGADRRRTVSLSIEASDGERWEKKIALAPNGRWRRVIEMAGSPPDGVTVRAEAGADNFEADNVAYLARRRASAVKVALVGREDPSLRKALLSAGGVEVIVAASPPAVTPASVDVVVFVHTA
ncbi:MAG: BatA domain-containing protein, partial [Planctomycetia bacterium]|nr:BatA domain-containing protein [Planctomycetia bacterium]